MQRPDTFGGWRFRPGGGGLLVLLSLPLLSAVFFSLLRGDLPRLGMNVTAFGLLLGAAALIKAGRRLEVEYNERTVAKPPRWPRKLLGGICAGLASGGLAWFSVGYPWPVSLCFGGFAWLGCHLLYGVDPWQEKRLEGAAGVSSNTLTRALSEGEEAIRAIEAARISLRNRELRERLGRIATRAREILRHIQQDPADLRRASKFLNVHLEGARRVSVSYARTHSQGVPGELEDNFRRVLDTIERAFDDQYRRLQEHDRLDLDVKIEVLSKQLREEGFLADSREAATLAIGTPAGDRHREV